MNEMMIEATGWFTCDGLIDAWTNICDYEWRNFGLWVR